MRRMNKKPPPSVEFSAWDDLCFTLLGGFALLLPIGLSALIVWGLISLLT